MQSPNLTQVIQEWTEIFARRSIYEFRKFMEEAALSPSQVHTLMRLYHEGSCGISDISSHLGISNAASSQMVERMVGQGLLERAEDPLDRRVRQVHLTDRGRALVDESTQARMCWMEALTQALSPQDQEAIITGLVLLTRAARTLDPDSDLPARVQPAEKAI